MEQIVPYQINRDRTFWLAWLRTVEAAGANPALGSNRSLEAGGRSDGCSQHLPEKVR